jgi:hypothetical protein
MPRNQTLLLFFFVLSLQGAAPPKYSPPPLRTEPPPKTWEGVEKQINEVLQSRSAIEASKRYRLLFQGIGADGLGKLQTSAYDGIAIQAAWEEVILSVPRLKLRGRLRPEYEKLLWFHGFLEARARAKAPVWWLESLADSYANNVNRVNPGMLERDFDRKAGLDTAMAPSNTTLRREGDSIILRVEKESVSIPESLLTKHSDGKVYCHVNAFFTPRRCYVAVYSNSGSSYNLTCIDRKSAKVSWQSKVWATYWSGGLSGTVYTRVEVKEQDRRVFVFGSGTTGMHVEAFRSEDGTNLFRFANRY